MRRHLRWQPMNRHTLQLLVTLAKELHAAAFQPKPSWLMLRDADVAAPLHLHTGGVLHRPSGPSLTLCCTCPASNFAFLPQLTHLLNSILLGMCFALHTHTHTHTSTLRAPISVWWGLSASASSSSYAYPLLRSSSCKSTKNKLRWLCRFARA
jgi:hypothetical protein